MTEPVAGMRLIGVPYDLHRPDYRMGATPAALLPRLAALPLGWAGPPRMLAVAGLSGAEQPDLGRIAAALAAEVRAVRAADELPVIVGGDCLVSIGVMGGLGGAAGGVAWFDAHGDFNTPTTTPSGYLGGMPLAALAGRCLPDLCAAAGLPAPVPETRIALLGVRDLDPLERAALESAPVAMLSTEQIRNDPAALAAALAQCGLAGPVYLHLDLDVLDPAVLPGAVYPTPGGLQFAELAAAVRAVRAHCTLAAVSLTAVNVTGGDQETILAAAQAAAQAALMS